MLVKRTQKSNAVDENLWNVRVNNNNNNNNNNNIDSF